ncbi:sulfite exporter TauE/SafE family protein [Pseudomonas sp. zfem005]|uniref:sulfite exporter TauE/SafE family protein n=1 Tax=Pseudomonas sp. zfem005 TaxID=3078200 RepID=UPI0029293EBC|nr:sulfite exporter TauE/SafE family protein [Pseudomonas sp. zfem005]MDU9412180.1 sulfite exporter TauE/SafE family protein [Pseudomonas sp. zfem005]
MLLLFSALVFLLAGLVKGVLGMGLPTVAMGLLAVAMTPGEASALLLVPSLLTNLWQLFAGPALLPLLRRLWPLLLTLTLGTLVTTRWLVESASPWIPVALGACLLAYGALGLLSIRPPAPKSREGAWSALAGLLTGLVTGLTGVFVIPAVPYLQALGLPREALIQALGLSFTVSTLALGLGLFIHGGSQSLDLGLTWLMLLPALLGLEIGQRIRRRLSEAMFRRLFFLGLLGLGAHSLLRGAMALAG